MLCGKDTVSLVTLWCLAWKPVSAVSELSLESVSLTWVSLGGSEGFASSQEVLRLCAYKLSASSQE